MNTKNTMVISYQQYSKLKNVLLFNETQKFELDFFLKSTVRVNVSDRKRGIQMTCDDPISHKGSKSESKVEKS